MAGHVPEPAFGALEGGRADRDRRPGSEHWNRYYAGLRDSGRDLDWGSRWIEGFRSFLEMADGPVLDLGCGTGNDVRRLADLGVPTLGLDFSGAGLASARAKGITQPLVLADMAGGLPFVAGAIWAAMANASLHVFPEDATKRVLADLHRVVRPGGLLMLHVNSGGQLPIQRRLGMAGVELAPDYFANADGTADRFFSEESLRGLLGAWTVLHLEHVEIAGPAGQVIKCVWRTVARR